MSGKKECDNHKNRRRTICWGILYAILTLIIIIGLIVFIIWAVLRPTKPSFVLQDATLYGFNLTSPAQLTAIVQVTVIARNPNDRISIYYDRMKIYATYRDEQITNPTEIPSTYQESQGTNIWSPFLHAQFVPIAPFLWARMNQELQMGGVGLMIKVDGRVRWRVGAFISGPYRLHVMCPAIIPLGNPSIGILVGNNALKYQLTQDCYVIV